MALQIVFILSHFQISKIFVLGCINIKITVNVRLKEVKNIFSFDEKLKVSKSKQIINSVMEALKKGNLRIGEQLPSLNNVSFELDVSKDTVQRAYVGLCERGIVESVPGKGFYIKAKPADNALKVLLVFNKLTAYKKTIYNAFMRQVGTRAVIDFHIHDYDPNRFESIIKASIDKYDYYLIMPFFYHYNQNIVDVFKLIPKNKLVLVNKNVSFLDFEYPVIFEDFENDIFEALFPVIREIKCFRRILLIYPIDPKSNREIITGFERFCKTFNLPYEVFIGMTEVSPRAKELYIIIDDDDLVEFIKICKDRKLIIGNDVGIISYNDTVLKEVLMEGITVISTDFAFMGEKLANIILTNQKVKIKNPFKMIRRKSF